MTALVSFIGWHDSGKTTLAASVVRNLKNMGYRVAVIKSSSQENISFDTPNTDTYKHRQAGADAVMLVAPDQMVLQSGIFGRKVRIEGIGIFEVNDLMNKRYTQRIDIFMWDEDQARQFGKKNIKAALLEI